MRARSTLDWLQSKIFLVVLTDINGVFVSALVGVNFIFLAVNFLL